MKDLIWTIILIWLAYKIFEMVKSVSKSNSKASKVDINQTKTHKTEDRFKDAEYVDYEEIK